MAEVMLFLFASSVLLIIILLVLLVILALHKPGRSSLSKVKEDISKIKKQINQDSN